MKENGSCWIIDQAIIGLSARMPCDERVNRVDVARINRGDGLMETWESEPKLILYSTRGCHLCERAELLIRDATGVAVHPVEIADDDELLERYGARIPVLQRQDTGEELNWPFDAKAVLQMLAA
jgi:Glutaredoxin-like domain (DUF836)